MQNDAQRVLCIALPLMTVLAIACLSLALWIALYA